MATVVSIRRPLNRLHRLVPVSISNSSGPRSPLKSSPNGTAYVSPPVKLPRVGLLICSDRLPRGHTLLMEMYWSVPYLPPSYVRHLRDRPTPVSRTYPCVQNSTGFSPLQQAVNHGVRQIITTERASWDARFICYSHDKSQACPKLHAVIYEV